MYRHLILAAELFVAIAVSVSAETLSGRVVEDRAGAPVPSADVKIYKDGLRNLAADLETDSDGRFSADGLTPGDYRAEISKPNHVDLKVRFQIVAGTPVKLGLRVTRCGVISGQVVDGAGQPIRG